MAHKSDYDKVYFCLALVGVAVLSVNLYYYGRPLFGPPGIVTGILDSMMLKLRSEGVFDSPLKTKGLSLALFALCLVVRGGKGKKTPWWSIMAALAVGGILYVIPFRGAVAHIFFTVSGLSVLCWAFAMIGRRIGQFNEADNDRAETFEQCEELIETDDSINIPTVYQYRHRMRHGWINVVNPFRATLVLGTPGSGKSFSVYGPFIEQMIAKGYSMFVYDYKYPDLTEIVYNELLHNTKGYKVKPEFCVLNFQDPRYSLRCNPINPEYITDPADTTEIAELVMLNINRQAIEKEDFFSQSAKVYLDGNIYFLSKYENGRYCTLPHVIELMSQDYRKVFWILSQFPELAAKIKPFQNALEGNAQDQLQGQIASAQIPLNKFVSPALYWVLSGNDFNLDINDPEHPKILCVGNDPDRQSIYGTTLALAISRMFKLVNHKGKLKCGILLDEMPTVYLKGVDNTIATIRSNKGALVIGGQDESQFRRDYGEKESEVIFNTVGNIFSGQVNGKTAEKLSRSLGKEFRRRESQTRSVESDSVNISFQQEELLPVSTIETLSQGTFFGKVADSNSHKIDKKFFCGEIQIDSKKQAEKRKHWKKLPQMTDFGEEEIRKDVMSDTEKVLLEWIAENLRKNSNIVLSESELDTAAREELRTMSEERKNGVLESVIEKRIKAKVDRMIDENFRRIQQDIRDLIDREYRPSGQNDEKENEPEIDPRLVDPFAD